MMECDRQLLGGYGCGGRAKVREVVRFKERFYRCGIREGRTAYMLWRGYNGENG